MHNRHWIRTILSLLVIRSLTLTAFAQDVIGSPTLEQPAKSNVSRAHGNRFGANRGYSGFQHRLEQAVGLTPEQRDAVHGLMAQQHEELSALRAGIEPKYASITQQTDAKIRALLNPEQQKKFDTFMVQEKATNSSKRRRTS
jgi:hypothetical protein